MTESGQPVTVVVADDQSAVRYALPNDYADRGA